MERFRATVADIGHLAQHDVIRARNEILKYVSNVTMRPAGNVLVAETNRAHVAGALLSAAGGSLQMVYGSGARYGTFRQQIHLV